VHNFYLINCLQLHLHIILANYSVSKKSSRPWNFLQYFHSGQRYLCEILPICISTATVSSRHHPCSWWSNIHGCPLLAIVRFRWLEVASGTNCSPTPPQLQRWLFSGTATKFNSFPDHFLPVFGFYFCTPCI